MTCTWCSSDAHQPFQHGGLALRPDWDGQAPGPFLSPDDSKPWVVVTLADADMERAQAQALVIAQYTKRKRLKDTAKWKGDQAARIAQDTRGCLGEIAVAVFLGVPWRPRTGNYGGADVAGVHVRTTDRPAGRLPVREHEHTGTYVLVVDQFPSMRLAGWAFARDVRRGEHVALDPSRPACYVLTQGRLRPMRDLVTTHRSAAGLPPAGVG